MNKNTFRVIPKTSFMHQIVASFDTFNKQTFWWGWGHLNKENQSRWGISFYKWGLLNLLEISILDKRRLKIKTNRGGLSVISKLKIREK